MPGLKPDIVMKQLKELSSHNMPAIEERSHITFSYKLELRLSEVRIPIYSVNRNSKSELKQSSFGFSFG